MSSHPRHRPLDGVRVIDFSRYLPGPFAALNLSWLGAKVTAIEQPPNGDMMRVMPPYDEAGISRAYRSVRRDCEVVFADLGDPDELERVLELIAECDVVLESFRPGVADRLGIGATELCARFPRLVYASISGFGQTGPWRNAPGHDLGYQAMAGLLERDPAAHELYPPAVPVADLAGGSSCATAICAALFDRERTGLGSVIDIALSEAALAFQVSALPGADERLGQAGSSMLTGGLAAYSAYQCADGEWITVGAIEAPFFAALAEQIGLDNPPSNHLDPAIQSQLRADLSAVFAQRTAQEWSELLTGSDGGDCCVVNVPRGAGLAAHPQFEARDAVTHSEYGWIPRSPFVFDAVRSDSTV